MAHKGQKMVLVVLCTLVALFWFSEEAPAATLEVGSGKTYASIQTAINAANGPDEIIVYAGTYDGFVIDGKSQLTVRAHKDPADCAGVLERVTIIEPIYCVNSAQYNIIRGFYVANETTNASCGSYDNAQGNTWLKLVIYGAGSCAMYASNMYGSDLFDHCTIYDNDYVVSYTNLPFRINAYDTIVAFNDDWGVASGSAYYCNFFDNPDPNSGYEAGWTIGEGCISADPLFVSTDPASRHFLHLQPSSPCNSSASDGSDMGALPVSSVTYYDLLWYEPGYGQSWQRQGNNQIKLVFFQSLSNLPAVPLKIVQDYTATDLGDGFTYSLATTNIPDDTLIATENGTVLKNRIWCCIEPAEDWAEPFEIWILALRGDIVSNGVVDSLDYATLAAAWADSGSSLGRVDLDGDDDVDNTDLAILTDNWTAVEMEDPLAPVEFFKFAENPVLGPSASPATDAGYTNHNCVRIAPDGTFMMWYSALPCNGCYPRRIHLATSTDGINWAKQGAVLDKGYDPNDFDKYQVHMPTVLWDSSSSQWKMWYTGHGDGHPPDNWGWQRTGYATSPDGINWTKYGTDGLVFDCDPNPDAFDHSTMRSPAVLYDPDDGIYKMWYYGTKTNMDHYGPTGYAESSDGVNWTRIAQINEDDFQYVTPEVLKINDIFYMWHNIGPYIGYSVSLDGIAWTDDPANPVLIPGSPGEWDYQYLQGPSCVYLPTDDKLYLYYNAIRSYTTDPVERIGAAWTWFEPN